jgi:SH3 domain-containing YSC84-like protein 1
MLTFIRSVIVERQDANAIAYRSDDITVKMLLSGAVPPPEWAQPLVRTLESCTGMPGGRKWVHDTPATPGVEQTDPFGMPTPPLPQEYAFGGVGHDSASQKASSKKKKGGVFPPATWGRNKSTGSYFEDYGAPTDSFGGATASGSTSLSHKSGARSEDLSQRIRNMDLDDHRATPSSQDNFRFDTHFDSDFVPEEQLRKHPHMSSTAPSLASGTLVDIDDNAARPSSNLYPLAPASKPLYGIGQREQAPLDPFFSIEEAQHTASPLSSASQLGRPSLASALSYPAFSSPSRNSHSFSSPPFGGPPGRTFSPADTFLTALDDDLYGGGSPPAQRRSLGGLRTTSPPAHLHLKPELTQPLPSSAVGRAIALYDFDAVQVSGVSFAFDTTGVPDRPACLGSLGISRSRRARLLQSRKNQKTQIHGRLSLSCYWSIC